MIVLFVIIVFFLFILYGFLSNYSCKVTNTVILTEKKLGAFNGEKIAIISDLHGVTFGKENKKLIQKINKNKPDLIFVTGDLIVKNGKGFRNAVKLLEQLIYSYPIYFVPGNHEIELEEDYRLQLKDEMKRLGVVCLDNNSVLLQKKNSCICLSGLNLSEEYYEKFWKRAELPIEAIETRIGEADEMFLQVLLAHNPQYFSEYAKWGADVVFSGHLHGGIMAFPFHSGALAPNLRIFPKYARGLCKKDGAQMYVSRGLGMHHIKLRFFNLPELAIVTLREKRLANPKEDR